LIIAQCVQARKPAKDSALAGWPVDAEDLLAVGRSYGLSHNNESLLTRMLRLEPLSGCVFL